MFVCLVVVNVLLAQPILAAQEPSIEILEGAVLDGEPIRGVIYRGAAIPEHEVIGAVLRTLSEDRETQIFWYDDVLERLGIAPESAAEKALLRALEHPFFDPGHGQRPAWDLSRPGQRRAMNEAKVEDVAILGRIFGTLLRSLEAAGYDSKRLFRYLEIRRAGMSVTYLQDEDPRPEIAEQSAAFERARERGMNP